MSDLEKICFSVDIRSDTRLSINKIIQQLYINGLEAESTDMGIESTGTIFQKITGRYPGGQKALDSKIDEIRNKSGPCTFPASFDPFVFTPDGNVVDKLQEFGFRIISQKSNSFELEYKNGYDEACCRLGDALLELYQEKKQA